MPGNPKFGRYVRNLREARRALDPAFSLRRFAEAVGISPTFLSKIEMGDFDPPASGKIIKMAELLHIDADELLAMAGKVDPELPQIIIGQPKAMADFLRTVRDKNLSAGDIEDITRRIRSKKKS